MSAETMNRFNRVLVANRGEIACRVMRSVREAGMQSVAVYSDADKDAPHVKMADQSVCIGAAPATQSYLVIDKILQAAKDTGAQAIHPGYGFLSENADFAKACADAGLVFIGPSATAIDVMGNKAEAKRRMLAAGVPCVPGYEGTDQSDDVLVSAAKEIGFPLMVKAAAGGGGRGMRLVHAEVEVADAIKLARSEALNAFASDELILEKAIIEPRHVEVQVFADQQGNTVYLGERDCSVQRRHQKVVEEAPCPVMTPDLRQRMGEAAVAAAKSINYVGAGTVEFLLDSAGEFYFLEMNTRLQVEHPVTELVIGIDLVALQIAVAQGEALGFAQDDVKLNGHAIEVRLYSEDPSNDFLPAAGSVDLWHPATGEGVRIDDGIESGQAISPFYDPMVAKVIAYGENREVARRRLIKALQTSALFGVSNNKHFLIDCLEKQAFIDGQATTAFIEQEFAGGTWHENQATLTHSAVAAVLDVYFENQRCHALSYSVSSKLLNWSSNNSLVTRRRYEFDDQAFDLDIKPTGDAYQVTDRCSGNSLKLRIIEVNETNAEVLVEGERFNIAHRWTRAGELTLGFADLDASFQDSLTQSSSASEQKQGGQVVAPMHGSLLEVMVKVGDQVQEGDQLAVLEAMKMQHQITAPITGEVITVTEQGKQVAADDVLIEIKA